MKKSYRVLGSVAVVLGCLMVVFPAGAQSPDIVAFTGSGQLTWINNNTNLFYEVQWAPALNDTSSWRSGYSSLGDVQSSAETLTLPVPMFYRILGNSNRTHFAAPVPRTGQAIVFRPGDDGDLKVGVEWPDPRFTVQSNTNVVLDNLTGLMWTRNTNLIGSKTNWDTAIDFCNALDHGGYTDWRLPNKGELMSLIDYSGQTNSPLVPGHPFGDIRWDNYWTSTTSCTNEAAYAWLVWMGSDPAGTVSRGGKVNSCYVWPVRGRQ